LAANSSEPISMGSYASLSIGATGNYTYSGELTPATANNTYRFGGGGGTLTVTGNLVDKTTSPTATRSLVVNGKVTLTGVNTYSGATTVNSGALTLSGSGSLNSLSAIALKGGVLLQNSTTPLMAPITFTSGALGGTGTYGNNLSVGSGHLSPGDGGVGTLTVAGNVSLSSNSILDYDFGATAGVCDRLTVTGDLTLDGTLNITSSDALVHGKYTLFSVYGATGVTDNGLDFGVVPAGHDWAYSIANDNGVYSVIVTAAPEPGTLILLATGLLGILAYAWRKRR
jgi:autotransporter-associated beta strand protein